MLFEIQNHIVVQGAIAVDRILSHAVQKVEFDPPDLDLPGAQLDRVAGQGDL